MKSQTQVHLAMKQQLEFYLERFRELYTQASEDLKACKALEYLIEEYSQFILNDTYTTLYHTMDISSAEKATLTEDLANITAQCVKVMERLRAQRLLTDCDSHTGYFDNIEQCIATEFGQFQITQDDKVLLIGSGSYPMTLVQIAHQTGASVIGLDIDAEAVAYGKAVVSKLAPQYSIELTNEPLESLADLREVTHIIFSSTVAEKYAILEQLYAYTRSDVTIAMRYGNDLKAIFNYPKQAVNATQWRCVGDIVQPHQLFDIAIYQKVACPGDGYGT